MIAMMTMVMNKVTLKLKIVIDAGNINRLKQLRPLHLSCEENEKNRRVQNIQEFYNV